MCLVKWVFNNQSIQKYQQNKHHVNDSEKFVDYDNVIHVFHINIQSLKEMINEIGALLND